MAEELIVTAGSKEEKYQELLPQIQAVVEGESDMIANMANVASMLHETFRFWWTGFYRVQTLSPTLPHNGEGDHTASSSMTNKPDGSPHYGGDVRRTERVFLLLGPFQGPLACTRIPKGKGVCGTAWERGETIIVPDVDAFPGHIACSSLSRSEIVVPIWKGDEVIAVLDIDSKELATFDEVDQRYLEEIVKVLAIGVGR
ncbi:MAG: GAF domain-containing protein [Bacteroidaceae bacterium]|nr:GAF domain-containing protein [Bacteroidaceae bacterium]